VNDFERTGHSCKEAGEGKKKLDGGERIVLKRDYVLKILNTRIILLLRIESSEPLTRGANHTNLDRKTREGSGVLKRENDPLRKRKGRVV